MDQENTTEVAAETVQRKSIVPSKYGTKYKKGGTDDLAKFINTQCTAEGGFSFDRFFQLCNVNGVDAAKVAHYKQQVDEKRHGAPGRARMTLRNMLATPARKNGGLNGLDGEFVQFHVPAAITPASAPQQANGDGGEAA